MTQPPRSTFDDAPMWRSHFAPQGGYEAMLQRFHKFFVPKSYLEIGVNTGNTLNLSHCASIAVDPEFKIKEFNLGSKPACHFFQMTSDEFFARNNPTQILGRSLDMAFLDGMHWFEFLLRDFINTEKHCQRNSVIFMHDCIPLDEHVGRRDMNDHRLAGQAQHPGWWAGDVWKVPAILLKHRPDLRLIAFDSAPTGLIAVTGLDPSSTVLSDRYFDIVHDFTAHSLHQHGDAYIDGLTMLDSRQYTRRSALSSLFWL